MKRNQKGFVFIETIIVTCVMLTSLMVVYSLYVSSRNTESRYTRYDDPVKLYQSYYVMKYLEGFDFRFLIQSINFNCGSLTNANSCREHTTCSWQDNKCIKRTRYEIIWQGRSDLFGSSYLKEYPFFDELWLHLHLRNIYVIPSNVSEISKCEDIEYDAICSNNQLVTYLKGIDDIENAYYAILEFSSTREGNTCNDNSSSCLTYYSYMIVGE